MRYGTGTGSETAKILNHPDIGNSGTGNICLTPTRRISDTGRTRPPENLRTGAEKARKNGENWAKKFETIA